MPQINLLDYAIVTQAYSAEADEIVLAQPGDQVAIAGPVHLCIRLQAANQTVDQLQQPAQLHHDVYAYDLMVPAGHTWNYRADEALSALRLGTNQGGRVVICPSSPTGPVKPVRTVADLPCDFAVSPLDSGEFFPAACEPCPPAAKVSLPPGTQPTLITPPAPGGCVRTRFFNGMFITSEDLETEQRFFRMKNKLQNQTLGEGVVWGLDVTCHGDAVCVHPGYAIDCCGNSLVVSAPYKVDVESLLRDPGAFTHLVPGRSATALDCDDDGVSAADTLRGVKNLVGKDCRRMHLLLEYVECPEEPRPVHGDPCSPEVTDCEMSRIRETVRLRLVPPRDYDPRGCIDAFLAEIGKLQGDGDSAPAPGGDWVERGAAVDVVPFLLDVRFEARGATASHVLRPQTRSAERILQAVADLDGTRVTISPRPEAGWSVFGGRFEDAGGNLLKDAGNLPWGSDLEFEFSGGEITDNPGLVIRDWCAVPGSGAGGSITGTTTLSIGLTEGPAARLVAVEVQPTQPRLKEIAAPRYPCTGDACGEDPLGGLFDLLPPFLHKDPRGTGKAVDWKVLLLAATYGWLASEMVRHRVGTSQQVASRRLETAAQIYQAALALLGGKKLGRAASARITEELRCLFQCWCRSFLYPGPECRHDPTGVVVGCVCIAGGRIRELDPLGGRRWVVTYPLLAHWGRQFGIAPLDVTLSRVFSLICCISELPPPIAGQRPVAGEAAVRPMVPAGNAYLLVGTTEETTAEMERARIAVGRERTVELDELVSHLVTGLRTAPAAPADHYEVVSLAGVPQIRLAVPLEAAFAPPPDRVAAVAREVVAAETVRARVRPLLRGPAGEVHSAVVMQVPIAGLAKHPLAEELQAAGLATSGDVLAREPEDLQALLGAADPSKARRVSELYRESERHAEIVGDAVVAALEVVVEKEDVSTRQELAEAEALRLFVGRLAYRLCRGRRKLIPRELLEAVVYNTLTTGRPRR